jgi:hypothetical protein
MKSFKKIVLFVLLLFSSHSYAFAEMAFLNEWTTPSGVIGAVRQNTAKDYLHLQIYASIEDLFYTPSTGSITHKGRLDELYFGHGIDTYGSKVVYIGGVASYTMADVRIYDYASGNPVLLQEINEFAPGGEFEDVILQSGGVVVCTNQNLVWLDNNLDLSAGVLKSLEGLGTHTYQGIAEGQADGQIYLAIDDMLTAWTTYPLAMNDIIEHDISAASDWTSISGIDSAGDYLAVLGENSGTPAGHKSLIVYSMPAPPDMFPTEIHRADIQAEGDFPSKIQVLSNGQVVLAGGQLVKLYGSDLAEKDSIVADAHELVDDEQVWLIEGLANNNHVAVVVQYVVSGTTIHKINILGLDGDNSNGNGSGDEDGDGIPDFQDPDFDYENSTESSSSGSGGCAMSTRGSSSPCLVWIFGVLALALLFCRSHRKISHLLVLGVVGIVMAGSTPAPAKAIEIEHREPIWKVEEVDFGGENPKLVFVASGNSLNVYEREKGSAELNLRTTLVFQELVDFAIDTSHGVYFFVLGADNRTSPVGREVIGYSWLDNDREGLLAEPLSMYRAHAQKLEDSILFRPSWDQEGRIVDVVVASGDVAGRNWIRQIPRPSAKNLGLSTLLEPIITFECEDSPLVATDGHELVIASDGRLFRLKEHPERELASLNRIDALETNRDRYTDLYGSQNSRIGVIGEDNLTEAGTKTIMIPGVSGGTRTDLAVTGDFRPIHLDFLGRERLVAVAGGKWVKILTWDLHPVPVAEFYSTGEISYLSASVDEEMLYLASGNRLEVVDLVAGNVVNPAGPSEDRLRRIIEDDSDLDGLEDENVEVSMGCSMQGSGFSGLILLGLLGLGILGLRVALHFKENHQRKGWYSLKEIEKLRLK